MATPSTRYFWNIAKRMKAGSKDNAAIANIAPQSDCEEGSENIFNAILMV